ncbi:ankyrin-2 [Brassica rapa]|uniref:ankyrin-2 n=1 Tax=Brassica campestris TaxID=3711 RepID=UPI00142D9D78|nr:ankyrin-2 [Brassica rapa]
MTGRLTMDPAKMVNGGKSKEEGNRKKRKNQQVTSSNMVLKRLLRPARYFDGLMTNPCYYNPTKPPRKPCLICASVQHVTKHCSMNHPDKDCSDKTSVCLRCGGLGHEMGLCKYEYTEDDLKNVQCYVCKGFGHLCCVEPCDSLPSLWAVSCYRCGELGHTGLSCGRHYEGSPDIQSGFGRLATSAAISELGKKRKRETATLSSLKTNDVDSQEISILHDSNWTKKKKRKKKKINKKSDQHVTPPESNGEKNDGNLEQHSKKNVESEQNFTAHESNRKKKNKNKKAKGEQTPVAEKPNLRSGWLTEYLEEDPFHRGKIRRLCSPTTPSGYDHHRLATTHMDHNYRSPRFISGGHYPGSHSTTQYDRNRINSSFESNEHLSGPPPRLWQRNYPPTSPIAPSGHSHHRLPVTPPGHNHWSPTFSSGGPYTGSLSVEPCGGNRRYLSFESNRHLLDPPIPRLRQSYYSPTSPITPSGHNHMLPTFSSGWHSTGSLSTIPPHGGNHRDSSFGSNGHHLDPPFSRGQPYYQSTSPITPAGHNHHMLPSTYNQRSPTFRSGGHYSSPLSSTRNGGNHRNSPFESSGHLSGPSTSRRHPYYPPTSSHHHHQQQNIYGHAPSRYGPPHHYGEFSGNYEQW